VTDKCLTPAGEIRRPDGPEILFARHELACRKSGGVRFHPGFADSLAMLRMTFARPMIVTSACRSAEHNATMRPRGHPRSLHIYDRCHHGAEGCCAIDIERQDPEYNARLVELALKASWAVGVSRSFIHLDRRIDLVGFARNVFGYGGR